MALAEQIARRLGAKLTGTRTVFDRGIVYLGLTEMAIKLTGVGYFFVKSTENVEAVVAKEHDRAEQSRRYRELQKWRSTIFGDLCSQV